MAMIPIELLNLLRCPETGQTLSVATGEQLSQGNRNKDLPDGTQTARTEPLTAALVRADQKVLYPVRDGIPVLLLDEAIRL